MPVFSKWRAARRHLLATCLAAGATGVSLLFVPAALADGPYLTLFETIADDTKFWAGNWKVSDGAASNDLYGEGSYVSQHTWSSPPAQMDASGFTISMQVTASVKSECGRFYTGTGIGGASFEYNIDPLGFPVNIEPPPNCDAAKAGKSMSNGGSVVVKPSAGLGDGQVAELKLNGFYGPAITYRYRVSTSPPDGFVPPVGGNPPQHPPGEDSLAAHLECPASIVISELPSLNCHIVITSWRRNTADPVEVILPGALDFYGNHANGIQLLQAAGEQDVFNWDAPYRWGMFVFACPSQSGTGANCFGSVTTPGDQFVDIIVRQGAEEVRLQLIINAIARPGSGSATICGFDVAQAIFNTWMQTGGEAGPLGCATGPEQDTARSPNGTDSRGVPFQGGAIVIHTTGPLAGTAFALSGSIGTLYIRMGGTGSWLGLPLTDEIDITGGRRTDFESGYIVWDRLTGGSIAMRDGSAMFSLEQNSNRGGNDLISFPAIDDRVEMCRDACAGESGCVAYTYVQPGWQGERAMCWLKSSVPPAAAHECCISGVKR